MDPFPLSVRVSCFIVFVVLYGWILHSAVNRSVYKITGIRALDSYLMSWLLGFAGAIPPVTLYVAFGFNEFASTPEGVKLQQRLHWAGRTQLALLTLYGLIILATVPQI
jgi:hypothetical protein